jgi:hypothetical protein
MYKMTVVLCSLLMMSNRDWRLLHEQSMKKSQCTMCGFLMRHIFNWIA